MWIPVAAILSALVVLALVSSIRGRSGTSEGTPAPVRDGSSILDWDTVQRSLETGAPPTPWMLRREDREAMDKLESFFARAIPNPGPDSRASVEETLGHGGPQLELRVPILRTRRPIAVLARRWDSNDRLLESDLYFFGSVDERLEKLVGKLGFEYSSSSPTYTAFRNRQELTHRRFLGITSLFLQADRESA